MMEEYLKLKTDMFPLPVPPILLYRGCHSRLVVYASKHIFMRTLPGILLKWDYITPTLCNFSLNKIFLNQSSWNITLLNT